jgi:PHD/YefM family antitoxin component YafN of YafNO toxin-antitoxin module
MYTTFHFESAEDITTDVLNAIKTTFKKKPVVLTVEEEKDETAYLMSNEANKTKLLQSIEQDKNGESIKVTISEIE